jgi:DNA-binding MarR family transcriptional regulator
MASPAVARPATRSSVCTCFKLRSLTRLVTQHYDRCLAPSGLTITQYALLGHARVLPGGGPPTVSELARRLYTDRTTLTRNLKPLVAAGWIEVAPGRDQRTKAVVVTPAGHAAFDAARPLWREAQSSLHALAGADTLTHLHQLVDDLLPHFTGDDDDV